MLEKPSFQHPEKIWTYGYAEDMIGKGPLYEKGLATQKSLISRTKFERPLAERVDRAELFHEVIHERKNLRQEKDLEKGKRSKKFLEKVEEKIQVIKERIGSIFDKSKKKDKIYAAFLDTKTISTDLGNLGTQKIDYVDIKTEYTDSTKNPMFIIMGVGNDSNGLGVFPHELAMETDRRIIMLPQPDSYHGRVTGRFMLAELFSRKFEPHTKFFKSTIQEICEKENIERFDICGVSAGAVIASDLIKDEELGKKIDKKNLMVPPGITPIYENPIKRMIMQARTIEDQRKKGKLPKTMVTDFTSVQKSWLDRIFQQGTFLIMALKLARRIPWWKDLKDTNIIIAREDAVTYGIKHIDKIASSNPNLKIKIINGGHERHSVEPGDAIKALDL